MRPSAIHAELVETRPGETLCGYTIEWRGRRMATTTRHERVTCGNCRRQLTAHPNLLGLMAAQVQPKLPGIDD